MSHSEDGKVLFLGLIVIGIAIMLMVWPLWFTTYFYSLSLVSIGAAFVSVSVYSLYDSSRSQQKDA